MFKEFSNAHTLRRPLLRWLLVLLALILIIVILISLYRNDGKSPNQEITRETTSDVPSLDPEQIRKQLEILAVQSQDAPVSPRQEEIQKQLGALAGQSQPAVTPNQEDIRAHWKF